MNIEETLEAKLSVVRQRWPDIAQRLDKSMANASVLKTDTPYAVLVYKGMHLSSAYDPIKEAQIQAESLKTTYEEAWIFGVGAGYLIDFVLRNPAVKTVHVVSFNLNLLLESLAVYPHQWLLAERVNLIHASELRLPRFPFAAVYAELMLADKASEPLRDRVITELNDKTRVANLRKRQEKFDYPNIKANMAEFANENDISQLKGCLNGKTITVIAGGPSADDFLISPIKSDAVIAVSTAVKPCLAASVAPDFVIALDSHPNLCKHLQSTYEHDLLARAHLVYAPAINPTIPVNWKGPRSRFVLNSPVYVDLNLMDKHSSLFASGTVAHAAVDLAVHMGASTVRLVGFDFGFYGGYSHMQHATHRKIVDTKQVIECVSGELINTSAAMIGYLRDLEMYIALQKDVDFVVMSDKGAKIACTRLYGNK